MGEHIHLGTQAAIKVLHVRLTGNDIEDFLKEARLVARLEHPHIVRVLEFGIEDNTPFLIMSYALNGTLREHYAKGTRLPLTTIVPYVKQVATALQYAHDRQLIHRDVKPENMLLGSSNEVLLSDFGVAIVAQSSRQQNPLDVAGTIAYMSPEQLQGKPRFASDQYALGVVVYEWLSGTTPFQGSFYEVASQHMHVPPPFLSKHVPEISPAVESVVMTAMEKDSQQRFASVLAFANALEQASSPHTSSVPHSPMFSPSYNAPTPVYPPVSALRSLPINTPFTSVQPLPQGTIIDPSAPTFSAIQNQQAPRQPKHRLSRRAVVGGLAGLVAAAAVGGSIAWYAFSPKGQETLLLTYNGHLLPVYALAWSPSGQYIVSSGQDKTAQIWNATTGDRSITYTGQQASVNAVVWSPNGQRIASGSSDTTVQVWNATTGKPLFTYRGHTDTMRSLAWSPNGMFIASGGDDKTVQVWHADTGKPLLTYAGHSDKVWSVAWSPDGTHIASASVDKTVQVWKVPSKSLLFTYQGHRNEVKAAAWSHDGTRIASISNDRTVQVWEVASQRALYIYRGHFDVLNAVAWSHDDKRIASGSGDYTVHILDAANGNHIFTYRGHSLAVHAVGWSRDDKRIASASDDHTVQVWKAI